MYVDVNRRIVRTEENEELSQQSGMVGHGHAGQASTEPTCKNTEK